MPKWTASWQREYVWILCAKREKMFQQNKNTWAGGGNKTENPHEDEGAMGLLNWSISVHHLFHL